jgi:hypothetical protein
MDRWNTVQACVDLERFGGPAPMGSVRRQNVRTGEVFSFEYMQRRESMRGAESSRLDGVGLSVGRSR